MGIFFLFPSFSWSVLSRVLANDIGAAISVRFYSLHYPKFISKVTDGNLVTRFGADSVTLRFCVQRLNPTCPPAAGFLTAVF